MSEPEIETAVAAYTSELLAEAELGRAEIAELEDHLRTLIGELREHGLPAAEAIAVAAQRLGDPRSVAREHARVRSVFGSRLGRARAWSIALLMVPMLASGFASLPGVWSRNMIAVVWSRNMLELAGALIVSIAMAMRLTWARPILLGGIAFWTLAVGVFCVRFPGFNAMWLVLHAGLLAFLLPWRRGEITAAGAALALDTWAFSAAMFALGFQLSRPDGSLFLAPGATVTLAASVLATAGGLLRAKWAAPAAAVASVGLAVACAQLSVLTVRLSAASPDLYRTAVLGLVGSGALAAAVSAVLGWRTARSRLGSFRALVS